MKTKKIKIIIAIMLSLVAIITSVLIALSLNKVSYYSNIEKPSRIVVYYNAQHNNIVFAPGDEDYEKLYSLLTASYKEPILKSLFNGRITNKAKIFSSTKTQINFDGINVAFVYNSPKVLKSNGKIYTVNNNDYWFKTLVFNINDNNQFAYNMVAVIPNENDVNYLGEFAYNVGIKACSNFSNLYNYCYQLF